MMDKATVEAAEKAFLEWQEKSARVGNMMTGYSPDRFPFHAGYYAAQKALQGEIDLAVQLHKALVEGLEDAEEQP